MIIGIYTSLALLLIAGLMLYQYAKYTNKFTSWSRLWLLHKCYMFDDLKNRSDDILDSHWLFTRWKSANALIIEADSRWAKRYGKNWKAIVESDIIINSLAWCMTKRTQTENAIHIGTGGKYAEVYNLLYGVN